MKFFGLAETGAFCAKTAISWLSPGRASRVSTTRFGALKPRATPPVVCPSTTGSFPSSHTSAASSTTISNTTVAPRVASAPMRSGSVSRSRYQANDTRPGPRRSVSDSGSIRVQDESSKPAVPAAGATSSVRPGAPEGFRSGPTPGDSISTSRASA